VELFRLNVEITSFYRKILSTKIRVIEIRVFLRDLIAIIKSRDALRASIRY